MLLNVKKVGQIFKIGISYNMNLNKKIGIQIKDWKTGKVLIEMFCMLIVSLASCILLLTEFGTATNKYKLHEKEEWGKYQRDNIPSPIKNNLKQKI